MGSELAPQAGSHREGGVPGPTSGTFMQTSVLPERQGTTLESSKQKSSNQQNGQVMKFSLPLLHLFHTADYETIVGVYAISWVHWSRSRSVA